MKLPKIGEVMMVGKRAYSICMDCGQLVCINKPIFGSMHVCGSEGRGEVSCKESVEQ